MYPANAIEILTDEKDDHHTFPTDLIGQALRLGIEALRLYLRIKAAAGPEFPYLLPGETED